jgi:hypothetical protein
MPSEAQQTHHLLGFFFEDRHQLKILAGFSPFSLLLAEANPPPSAL